RGVRFVRVAAVASNRPLQAAEEGQGEAGASLTVGGVGEVEAAEVTEFADGGVAVENLLEEEVGGDDGGKGALAERIVEVATDLLDEHLRNVGSEVTLDPAQGLGDSKHGGLLG